MWDPAWNQKRIEIAEKLLKKTDYMLVLVSTVDPMYFLTEECQRVFSVGKDGEIPQRLLERWARALDKFVRVKLPNLVEVEFAGAAGDFLEKGPPFAQFGKWICQECSYTPMLQKIGVEILENIDRCSSKRTRSFRLRNN